MVLLPEVTSAFSEKWCGEKDTGHQLKSRLLICTFLFHTPVKLVREPLHLRLKQQWCYTKNHRLLHRNNRTSSASLNVASFQNVLKCVCFSLVPCISPSQTRLPEVLIYSKEVSACTFVMIITLLDSGRPMITTRAMHTITSCFNSCSESTIA